LPTDPSQGNAVLGQIFGSKDVSRTVADNAASQSGLDSGDMNGDGNALDDILRMAGKANG
jgi:hypothetical protein